MAVEKWISGYEGKYKVTTDGQVWSERKHDYMRPMVTEKGYLKVELRSNGRRRYKVGVHRLVAEAFIPNPDNLPEVNHKDGIKTNNHVGNLEWCTRSENQKHAYRTGLERRVTGTDHHKSKLTQVEVNYIRNVYTPRDPVFGGTSLAALFRVDRKTITNVIRGVTYRS